MTSNKNKPDIGWIWLNYNDKDINYSDNALPRCDIDSHCFQYDVSKLKYHLIVERIVTLTINYTTS